MSNKKYLKSATKRPRPFYEEGELRDKSIEEKVVPNYRRETLQCIILNAATET